MYYLLHDSLSVPSAFHPELRSRNLAQAIPN
jgi:hypothetical protein